MADGKPSAVPYTVLYPLGGPVGGAPLADASEDAILVYQLTSVGGRVDQAEWMADRVRRVVLERTASGAPQYLLDVPGVDVWARELDADDGIDTATSAEGVVTSSQRYRFNATSST
ncbi:hypothetical protein ACFXKR_18130 [Streptomyces violascens]|uniref:hypothetical protein n=1 Tax=Streptomyces violascens TaxID=67381 RepID=UPI0036958ED0